MAPAEVFDDWDILMAGQHPEDWDQELLVPAQG
jgi:hypothetical protein